MVHFTITRSELEYINCDAIAIPTDETLTTTYAESCRVHDAGGEELKAHLERFGKTEVTKVRTTESFEGDSEIVLHCVTPHWQGGRYNETSQLHMTYLNLMVEADKHRATSLALPILGVEKSFPLEEAFRQAVRCVNGFKDFKHLATVIFVVRGVNDYAEACYIAEEEVTSVIEIDPTNPRVPKPKALKKSMLFK